MSVFSMYSSNAFYKAVIKSLTGRYIVYIANVISMMILARLFTPKMYGTLASLTVFLTFFQLMTEAGLGPAIINIRKLDEIDKNGLFGLTIVIGLIASIIFLLLGNFFAKFYADQTILVMLPYIAVSVFLYAASTVPAAFLLREQAFKHISYAGISSEVFSTISTILLLNIIMPIDALAVKSTISALVSFIVIYIFSSKTEFGSPKLGTHFSAIKPLLSFSLYQFAFNFINYFSRNLDKILIGKYMGMSILGAYDKSYQLMRYPLMLLTSAMVPAVQPALREYAHDKLKIEQIHRDFTFKLSIVGSLIGVTVFFMADFIVKILLGVQWVSVIPIIKILSITIPIQVVLSTSGSFYQLLGRADLLFLSGSISAFFMVTAILVGVFLKNVDVLSWCLVGAFSISFVQSYFIMYKKIFKISPLNFFKKMYFILLSLMLMISFSWLH